MPVPLLPQRPPDTLTRRPALGSCILSDEPALRPRPATAPPEMR